MCLTIDLISFSDKSPTFLLFSIPKALVIFLAVDRPMPKKLVKPIQTFLLFGISLFPIRAIYYLFLVELSLSLFMFRIFPTANITMSFSFNHLTIAAHYFN